MCKLVNGIFDNWISLLAVFISIVSCYYNHWQKPKVKGKLVSHHENDANLTFGNSPKDGTVYFLALNLTCIYQPFHIKEVKVNLFVRASKWKCLLFLGLKKRYKGHLFFAKTTWKSPGNGAEIKLKVKPEDHILYSPTIPLNETKLLYVTFYVDKKDLESPILNESPIVKFTFIDFSGHKSTLKIDYSKINVEQMLWDDRIWEKTN